MEFKVNKKYRITVTIQGRDLTYYALILRDEGDAIVFTDKFNKQWYYAKSIIIQVEEFEW